MSQESFHVQPHQSETGSNPKTERLTAIANRKREIAGQRGHIQAAVVELHNINWGAVEAIAA